MKECLHCKKEFKNTKESAKFCSTSCRVMWNRKNGNKTKKALQPLELQVLYNSLLDAIEKFGNINGQHQGAVKVVVEQNVVQDDEKSFQQYLNEIADLEYEQEFKDKATEIQSATNLSQKEKDLLLTNMRTSKF